MIMLSSLRNMLLSFILLVGLVALLFWLYLNLQASLSISSQRASIQLSKSLATTIHVGNHLQTHAVGNLDTIIALDRTLQLPLKGRYLAELDFAVETPITVDIDYQTNIKIESVMPLETTTDLVYQNSLLPKFPLKLNIPIKMNVPFHLKRRYRLPIKIDFNGLVYFDFNEMLEVPVKHQFKPILAINDPVQMDRIASFNATMYNLNRDTTANLEMQMTLPLKNLHP